MSVKKISLAAVCATAALLTGLSFAGEDKGSMPQLSPEAQKYMEACMAAGMVGEQHSKLAAWAGTWTGDMTMYMPGMPAMTSPQKWVMTSEFGGKFVKCEVTSDMGEMGTFNGLGFTGFDNVSQKYVGSWLDSMGTGIMHGTGEYSADGKTFTMTFQTHCPVTKKVVPFREVIHLDNDSIHVEFYGMDPNSGEEVKSMEGHLTRQK